MARAGGSEYNSAMNSLHRMTDDELSSVLALLAGSGGTARTVESWRQDCMTGLVLGGKGEAPHAVMPISKRTVMVSPGSGGNAERTITAGWLSSNQFAARMGLRRQT